MKTEQAVSPGGTRFGASMDMRKHVPPLVWLNLVCLDAPIVAVAWLWLFARTFQLPVHWGNAVALFLTAWLIYLADRLADAVALKPEMPRSLRQEFCLRHRETWISALLLIGGFDLYVVWRSIASGTFLAGAVVGILAIVYLALNYPRGLIWRSLPAKEITIGLLFTAGTLVALLPSRASISAAFVGAGLTFAFLCALNCISIAAWERPLDEAQGKVSIATHHPGFTTQVAKICGGLVLVSLLLALVYRVAAPVLISAGVSALLLGWLYASWGMNRDQRTALADLVLLTPVIALIAMPS